ncbi:MAG: hypothetical protein IPJ13_08820 [Saprospiraceae bacterium]|nr:hypothetical protein [Saprospiraceae bacterium]MBP6446373.1 hypothetical protein [Saprospiraceae bacterium]
MKDFTLYFHRASYLQYPLMLVAVGYCYKPLISGFETMWADYNYALIFMGLSISFSTLRDTTKTQNKMSKRVFENPVWAKRFLFYLLVLVIVFLCAGMYGLFASASEIINSLSYGLLSLGVGLIGLLKAAGEMAKFHFKGAG